MNRLRIATRVGLLAALLILLSCVMGALGLWGIARSNQALQVLHTERLATAVEVGKIQALLLQQRLLVATALITPDAASIAQNTQAIERNITTIGDIWKNFESRSHPADEARLARDFYEHRLRFVREGLEPTATALREGDVARAQELVVTRVRPLYTPVQAGMNALIQWQGQAGEQAYEEERQRYVLIRNSAIAALTIGLLFALWFTGTLVRGIRRALGQAVDVARTIARGDLSRPVTAHGRDEAADVLHALSGMQHQLIATVRQIRGGSEHVAAASSQIAQGNLDLSGRTEEQASALEETAASMEELSSTVKQNADSAHQAKQLVQSASEVASRGGEAVTKVVQTMNGISAASRKISDIISVIDGIAFQTNILALNAAVEAARAGEHGRGFAVVASEVRSLAGRAGEAAKEIHRLITDSVARVEEGNALVSHAGQTMEEVVTSIRRVNDIMGEISAASHEQSVGVSQVGEAVVQMDQTTQQNAALVEEMSAAAGSLNQQARDLLDAVSVFQLDYNASRQDGAHPAREHAPALQGRALAQLPA
ncbi:MAG: methyl-accepting chemotaxis protein [Comamonas sp.]